MKVVGLDGKIQTWSLMHGNNPERKSSAYHKKARTLLKELFRSDVIWEEVTIPGMRPPLYADFVLPFRKLVVEVHGEQHYKWIEHFHSTKKEFLIAQARDAKKSDWCKLNGLAFVELPYMETIDEWRERIINFGRTASDAEIQEETD